MYPYEQWSNRTVPPFRLHERFTPTAVELLPGQTTPPEMLTEADLINLMDKNGIGKSHAAFGAAARLKFILPCALSLV